VAAGPITDAANAAGPADAAAAVGVSKRLDRVFKMRDVAKTARWLVDGMVVYEVFTQKIGGVPISTNAQAEGRIFLRCNHDNCKSLTNGRPYTRESTMFKFNVVTEHHKSKHPSNSQGNTLNRAAMILAGEAIAAVQAAHDARVDEYEAYVEKARVIYVESAVARFLSKVSTWKGPTSMPTSEGVSKSIMAFVGKSGSWFPQMPIKKTPAAMADDG
jgi:hypothetical protein